MKKLSTLVTAISLGLAVSFAVLPVASAHLTYNVGHSYTTRSSQKPTSKVSRKPHRHPSTNLCEKPTTWPIPGPANFGSATITATTDKDAQPVASFVAPSVCANTFEASISWTPGYDTATDNVSSQLVCQWYEDSNPVGQRFVENSSWELAFVPPTFPTNTPIIFSTNVYAPPISTYYGHPFLDTFTLKCFAAAVNFSTGQPVTEAIPTTVQVSGNDSAGLAGLQLYQSEYISLHSEDDSGYPGYSARHHVNVK